MQSNKFSNKDEDNGVTYINGLGFVNEMQSRTIISSIRGNSNVMCFCIILYFLLNKSFILPATYLMYIFGGNIQINFYTGLIVASPFFKMSIMSFTQLASISVVGLLCFLINRKPLIQAKIFKRPYIGVTSLAVPITVAIGLLGVALSFVVSYIFRHFGILFHDTLVPIQKLDWLTIYGIIISMFFAVLQEILFRGFILTPLRRFGDGFAIIACSLLFAVWSGGFCEFIAAFFISIPLCYFTIRSGSICTAITSRIFFCTATTLMQICQGMLESSLAEVIILLGIVVISFFSAYCFILFIKEDKNAFKLKPAEDSVKLSAKVGTFVSSIVFIFFIIYQAIGVISSTQIIG